MHVGFFVVVVVFCVFFVNTCFQRMAILVQGLLTTQSNGIASIKNYFVWYFCTFNLSTVAGFVP